MSMGQRQQQNNNSNNNSINNNNKTQRVAEGNLSVDGGARGDAALSGNIMINENDRVSLFRTLQAFRPTLNPNRLSIYTIFSLIIV